jgi:hypothetical protein
LSESLAQKRRSSAAFLAPFKKQKGFPVIRVAFILLA